MHKRNRLNKKGFLLCLITLLMGIFTACGTTEENMEISSPSSDYKTEPDIESSDIEHTVIPSESGPLSGVIPDELEYIPEGYTSPAEHAGTLEKLTYDTWESFTYEQHSQKLTKEAWVYLPYGYTEDQSYNVMYISHGGWSNETTIMGTDTNPHSFKHVIDHAIEDGRIQPLIIVLPTYNNTSGSDSGNYSLAL